MKTNHDRTHLIRLCRRLTYLIALLQKKKPGTAYTEAEIRAISRFPGGSQFNGILDCVNALSTNIQLVPLLSEARRRDAIFYLKLLLNWARRLLTLIEEGEVKELQAISKELKRYDIENIKRNKLKSGKNKEFQQFIAQLLKSMGVLNDQADSNNSKVTKLYLHLISHYISHKQKLAQTKEEYAFLAISGYMLYARNLELIPLLETRKR